MRPPDPRALAVDCPRCGREAGDHCRTKGGSLRVNHPHLERRKAAR